MNNQSMIEQFWFLQYSLLNSENWLPGSPSAKFVGRQFVMFEMALGEQEDRKKKAGTALKPPRNQVERTMNN